MYFLKIDWQKWKNRKGFFFAKLAKIFTDIHCRSWEFGQISKVWKLNIKRQLIQKKKWLILIIKSNDRVIIY